MSRLCARYRAPLRAPLQLELPHLRMSDRARASQLLRQAVDALRWGDWRRADSLVSHALDVLEPSSDASEHR